MEKTLIEAVKWLLSQHLDAFHAKVRSEAKDHLAAVTELSTAPAAAISAAATNSSAPAAGTTSATTTAAAETKGK
jgi:hypothetical protein